MLISFLLTRHTHSRSIIRLTAAQQIHYSNMPQYNVSLKEGADAQHLDAAKKQVTEQGGKIVHEFTLIKGFTAEFPADKIHTLSNNDALSVEADGQVKTQ